MCIGQKKKKEIRKGEAETWKILHEYRWKNTLFMGTGNKIHVYKVNKDSHCFLLPFYTYIYKMY